MQNIYTIRRGGGPRSQAPLEKIHFHEVGALDAIVDVVGAAIVSSFSVLSASLVRRFTSEAGLIEMADGRFPVPPPAVTELFRGVPFYSGGDKRGIGDAHRRCDHHDCLRGVWTDTTDKSG